MELTYRILLMAGIMVLLIFLSGWFSGSETALTHLTPSSMAGIRSGKDRRSRCLVRLKKDMDRTIVTILIGNNLVNILLSSISALFANALFNEVGVTVMVGAITFLIIVFGEITPKSYALRNPRAVSLRNAVPIHILSTVLFPLVRLFHLISGGILFLLGQREKKKGLLVTDQEIRDLATLGVEEGLIKNIEKDLIHGVLTFGDRKVSEVMIPMRDVFFMDRDMDIETARKVLSKGGFTRVPFIGPEGRITGLIYSKDLLNASGNIRKLMKPVIAVRDREDITDLFRKMKRSRIHMAVVENDKGDHVGIITLEDLIEEMVGEIYDEFYPQKASTLRHPGKAGV